MPKKYTQLYPTTLELVDVVDVNNRPLAVLPIAEVHHQALLHRSVLVLVYDTTQRLFLQRYETGKTYYSGCYGLSATGHVRAGEAIAEAASRKLREELGLTAERLNPRISVPASIATEYEFVTMFTTGHIADLSILNLAKMENGLYVDRHELAYLVTNFRELLTTTLMYAWEHNLLFP